MNTIHLREAKQNDAEVIALLHAHSWQSAYKGLLPEDMLDDSLLLERETYWINKLASLSTKEFVILAEDNTGIIGFAAVMDKPEKGYQALLDNLHVRPELKGKGVGGMLMKEVATRLLASGRATFYLWVLEGNTPAELFYKAKGGLPADKATALLAGHQVMDTRYVWDSFEKLLD